MVFRSIRIEDKQLMEPYLKNNSYGICDFSFANIFIWQEHYGTQFCLHKNSLLLRGTAREIPYYMMPLGSVEDSEKLKEIMTDLLVFSEVRPFKMTSITTVMSDRLLEVLPENTRYEKNGADSDYIYLSENMINLPGKKLSAKRNHINKFLSLYGDNYEYTELCDDIVPDLKEMTRQWCEERGCDKKDTDFCVAMTALNNWRALELKGGAIKAAGKVVAYTLGQPNNSEVFDIIIEKGLKSIEGAYAMINREFAKRECAAYKFINREDDMGVDGLRKAKLSYHPYLLLEKGVIIS